MLVSPMYSIPTSLATSRRSSIDQSAKSTSPSCRRVAFYKIVPKQMPQSPSNLGRSITTSRSIGLKGVRLNSTVDKDQSGSSLASPRSFTSRLSYLKQHDGDVGPTKNKIHLLNPNLATTALFARAVVMSGLFPQI